MAVCPNCGCLMEHGYTMCPICEIDIKEYAAKKEPEAKPDEQKKEPAGLSPEEKAKRNELMAKLFQWSLEGYDVKPLEDMLYKESKDLAAEFEKWEKSIQRLEAIKTEVGNLDVRGLEADGNALVTSLTKPMNLSVVEKSLELLKRKIRLRDISEELQRIPPKGLEKDIEAVKSVLSDPDKVAEAEKQFKILKKKLKESAFTSDVWTALQKQAEPPRVVKVKIVRAPPVERKKPMVIQDVFLLYKDNRLMVQQNRRPPGADKSESVLALKSVTSFLSSGGAPAGQMGKVKLDKATLLIQRGKSVSIALAIYGEEHPWSSKLIGKVIDIIESQFPKTLEKWDGKIDSIRPAHKFLNALVIAFARLSAPAMTGQVAS